MMNLPDRFIHKFLRRPYKLAKAFDRGKGSPIILLHGLASSSEVWRPLIENHTFDKHRVVALDLLGFGKSPKPDWSTYSVEDHAAAVYATIRSMRLRRKVTIVAHSMGCLVAAHLAATRPRLVSRMILFEPPLFADIPDYKSHSRMRNIYMAAFGHIASKQELVIKYNRFIGRWANKSTAFDIDADNWLPFERSLRNTIMQQNAYEELRSTTTPTDIIHGRMDMVVIRTDVKDMLDENPHITFHVINESHGLSKRSAGFLAKLIRD